MFTVYDSNKLSSLSEMLIEVQKVAPNDNPFEPETILVQSQGMAQWLQMRMADAFGVAGQFDFPFPTSFLWQQYRLLFPHLPKENIFERQTMIWRLMRIIPNLFSEPECQVLKHYLSEEKSAETYQLKLFQLSSKIADLFDQYLVYRPHWLLAWEKEDYQTILNELRSSANSTESDSDALLTNIIWQGKLWLALVKDIQSDTDELVFTTSHRAYLQQQYFSKLDNLTEEEKLLLPKRIFIFGISSLPASQLAVLSKLSEHIQVHLFFLNPSEMYWGDNIEDRVVEKIALKQSLSEEDLQALLAQQGNQLLAMWAKQGREFLAQLVELEPNQIEVFLPHEETHALAQIKNAMLNNENAVIREKDSSIQVHACHSLMREVEVLHNQLLSYFEANSALSPKDIIVMAADIEQYAPYIQAVFSRYKKEDSRYIPFTISDQRMSQLDPVIASFLQLLSMKESEFSAETVFSLLEVVAIREKFSISEAELARLRSWINAAGVRLGLNIEQPNWQNYNAWENGIERLLLGTCLKAENGIWEDRIALDESYGLSAESVGKLANFLQNLTAWAALLHQENSIQMWAAALRDFVQRFYADTAEAQMALSSIATEIEQLETRITQAHFTAPISLEVLNLLLQERLNQTQSHLTFLAGKVNFCTLLPMRAIPFKVVCLLGMNEGEFPRQHTHNGFDLMQIKPQKGDRARRDDDRYLFLEALLSAQDIFYVSYIGHTLTKNEPLYPSILVSQLLEQLAGESGEIKPAEMITDHPMTNFSHKNEVSFDNEWLQVFANHAEIQPFMDTQETNARDVGQINLDDLISFVQSPIKHYFNQKLGIYFNHVEDEIAETEPFSFSALENYHVLNALVEIQEDELKTFISHERLKGQLPVSYFGELTARILNQKVSILREALSEYLVMLPENIHVEMDFTPWLDFKCKLEGLIPHRYHNKIVLWRVGTLRDKDLIQLWIYHLVLSALERKESVVYYYLDKEKQNELSICKFEAISPEQAKQQLAIYLKDYFTSTSQLALVVTEKIEEYLENGEETTLEMLEKLTERNDGIYLKRVLKQTEQINTQQIYQTTENWFKTMFEHQII